MANERARGLGYKFVTDDKYLVFAYGWYKL